MFGSSRSGAGAYAKVGLETGVLAASPHKLIVMLFEGTITAVNAALVHMKANQFEQKGKSISKAIQIIDEGMRASLDKKAGGEIAANLDSLYAYIVQCLLQGNLHNNPAPVEEALGLLCDLKASWDAIGTTVQPAASPQRPMAYDGLAPRASNYVSA